MNKNSIIYISGHTGFVGGALKKRLEDEGFYILTSESFKGANKKRLDLTNRDDVEFFFSRNNNIEYVFNCAGKVGGIKANMGNPYGFLYENLQIQNNLIDLSIKYKVKKFLNLGSSCIYPKDYIQPLKEEYLLKAPVEETNEGYALAKICGLKLCEYANKQFDTKFISLMPSNLYGPGDNFDPEKSHVLSALVKKICDAKKEGNNEIEIWGTGNARREFLYIDDLIDGMLWAMEKIDKTDTFLNIGPGYDISIKDLASFIRYFCGWEGEFKFNISKPDGMMKKCMDVSKINMLGWKSKTPLEDGIKKTIEYYNMSK